MKITLEDQFTKTIIELKKDEDPTITDFFEAFENALINLTFSKFTIEDYILERAEEIKEINGRD